MWVSMLACGEVRFLGSSGQNFNSSKKNINWHQARVVLWMVRSLADTYAIFQCPEYLGCC